MKCRRGDVTGGVARRLDTKASSKMAKKSYVVGSENVFADLGHPRPAAALAKAELSRKIAALIAKRGLTQTAAAQLLEVDQPKVSAPSSTRVPRGGHRPDTAVRQTGRMSQSEVPARNAI